LSEEIKTKSLYEKIPIPFLPLFSESEYPWQILTRIKEYILSIPEKELIAYTCISENVWIGKNVKIYPTAIIEGPCIIGDESVVKLHKYLPIVVIQGHPGPHGQPGDPDYSTASKA
jgi:hypothetical protein